MEAPGKDLPPGPGGCWQKLPPAEGAVRSSLSSPLSAGSLCAQRLPTISSCFPFCPAAPVSQSVGWSTLSHASKRSTFLFCHSLRSSLLVRIHVITLDPLDHPLQPPYFKIHNLTYIWVFILSCHITYKSYELAHGCLGRPFRLTRDISILLGITTSEWLSMPSLIAYQLNTAWRHKCLIQSHVNLEITPDKSICRSRQDAGHDMLRGCVPYHLEFWRNITQ